MGSEARARKLADRIKVIVAQTLEFKIKDPRLGFITITDVRLTADLRDASVFYTVYGSDEDRAATADALASSKGLLRTEVGKGTGVKFTLPWNLCSMRSLRMRRMSRTYCAPRPKMTRGYTNRRRRQRMPGSQIRIANLTIRSPFCVTHERCRRC